MDGIIIIDKPQNYTSHDCVAILRRQTGIKKIGHTGTLDPMATGVLPLCLGRATRLVEYLEKEDKTYQGILRLGMETDTGDIWGRPLAEKAVKAYPKEEIQRIFHGFLGESQQIPPMYSAIKVGGKKLYEYARKGKTLDLEPRTIRINSLNVESVKEGEVVFSVTCSKGTYIRSLCQDLGRALGTLGTLAGLRRTRSGSFCLDQSVDIEQVKTMNRKEIGNRLLDLDYGLGHFPRLVLDREEIPDFFQGKTIGRKGVEAEVLYRVYGADLFLGIGMGQKQDQLKGKKVFVREITGGSI